MRTKLIPIGNSKGLRLPRTLIEQIGLTEEIDLQVRGDSLVIKPVRKARAGWDEEFRKMHEAGDDQLLDEADAHAFSKSDETEWTW